MAKRLIKFLRSVLTADPYQLFFLIGIVCLLTAHGLRWRPLSTPIQWGRLASRVGVFVYWDAGVIAHLLIIFAAMVAVYICFWPGNHPVRRITLFVMLPTAIGLISTFGRYLYMSGPNSTILQSSASVAVEKVRWVLEIFWQCPGATVAFFGLILISLFTFRLALGISTLPLAMSGIPSEDLTDANQWRRLQILIWFLVALTPIFVAVLIFVFLPVFLPWIRTNSFSSVTINFGAVMTYVVAGLIVGPEGRKTLRESVAKPGLKLMALALLLPFAIDLFISWGQKGVDQFHRTISHTDFVPLHESATLMLAGSFLSLFVPAFVEEIIFRGLLQTRFVHRYGLFRGIFLVNIVWAASHFYGDFTFSHKSYWQALDQLSVRIFVCLALGFVLSWLTLRSRSIVPAAVAHTLYNALDSFSPGLAFTGEVYVRCAIWAVAACILFKYWPIAANSDSEIVPPLTQAPSSGE